MANRDQSKPCVKGLDKAHAEQAHHPAGARKVGPEHYRKSSDSARPKK